MPIYEYQCRQCDHEFEAIQKLSDEPLRQCPACGELSLVKLVSAAGFRLKGGGWYETDFKGGNERKRNLVGDGGESKAGGDAKTGTDKSAPKTDKPASTSAEKASGTAT